MIKYITLSDLSETIRENIWKIPRDIDFIIGVPRSGMIAASIISSYLNVPLIDVDGYVAGINPYGGSRLTYFNMLHKKTNKALVIDDTVWNGRSMGEVKIKLSSVKDVQFTYACVYMEGPGSSAVDFFLEDVRMFTNGFSQLVLYEWNIFQHTETVTLRCLYDIDGVLCVEPPDERNEKEYTEYITNPNPLFIPKSRIGGLITYRLESNRSVTEKWLNDNCVRYNELIMFNASTWEERQRSGISPEIHKANFYKSHSNYSLFVESSDYQAKRIFEITGKPAFSVECNKIYQ